MANENKGVASFMTEDFNTVVSKYDAWLLVNGKNISILATTHAVLKGRGGLNYHYYTVTYEIVSESEQPAKSFFQPVDMGGEKVTV